ncbi:MAG: tRNA (adenosine(37)-N6)-threonylcarbamoyltransferase complex dimerization subunit type 1 TsaB [Bacilli bacterium]|nr:tRNA (adenosine(37)-N6)-threonylcarbamoyltransferase complex dimerization subunit type 1 TsaB [Bacilli bacterium]
MTSLFIDTSVEKITIAIVNDYTILSLVNKENNKTLSERIFLYIDECFKLANKKPNDIDRIYLVNGPGSFTGTRVGTTIAKVFAFALKIDIITLSSLEFIATSSSGDSNVLAFIDARRGFIYAGYYDKNLNVIIHDTHISINEIASIVDDNTTWIGYESIDDITNFEPKPDIIKIIKKHQFDKAVTVHNLVPNYLKKTEAEENFENANKNS